jgi:hypothetical protein
VVFLRVLRLLPPIKIALPGLTLSPENPCVGASALSPPLILLENMFGILAALGTYFVNIESDFSIIY